MGLAEHRPEAAHLPEQPLQRVDALARLLREEPAGLLGEVHQDRARFEDGDVPAVGAVVIDDRRNLVVGADLQERGLELLAPVDVDPDGRVVEAGLLEHDVDLLAVGRGFGVEIDHERAPRSVELLTAAIRRRASRFRLFRLAELVSRWASLLRIATAFETGPIATPLRPRHPS